jgi:uroporphyrinogen-III decarboxylase
MSEKTGSQHTEIELLRQARAKRIQDAIELRKPDRVPIKCYDDYFSLSLGGVTPGEAYYDPDRGVRTFLEQVVQFNWDGISLEGTFPGKASEILGLKTWKWGGHELKESQEFQFVETEYMLADEYDSFLKDPGDFVLRTMMPRMATALEPMGKLPPLLLMSDCNSPLELANLAGQPDFREMLERLIQAGEQMNSYYAALDWLNEALYEKGYPKKLGSMAHAPFDWISDYFRGLRGTMMDMYYQPDKLKAAIDLVTPIMITYSIESTKELGGTSVEIPLHRGAGPFMSNEQYADFYWPSLKELIFAIIDAGLDPVPYWEGEYTSRLKFLAELPPKTILGHFETVDKGKFKEILGDMMCFWGDVPAQLLMAGTPEEVKEYVRDLIELFSDTGGLIVDGSIGIPKESKYENVVAMTEAVFEFGVY